MSSMTQFSGTRSPDPPSGGSTRFIVLIVAGFIVVNAIGVLAYRVVKSQDEQPAAPVQPAAAAAAAAVAEVEEDDESLIRAYRAAGLQAFEEGDYDLAVEKLSRAAKLGGSGDIPELLLIAKEMQERARSRARRPVDAPPVAVAVSSDEASREPGDDEAGAAGEDPADRDGSSPDRRAVAQRRRPPPRIMSRRSNAPAEVASKKDIEQEAADVVEEKEPSILLVTSTPSKLEISIDGKTRDVTPARINLPPGTYRVALSYEGEVLHAQTVTVKAGESTLVNRDVTDKVASMKTQVAAPAALPPAEPAKPLPPPAERQVARARPEPVQYGEIYIQSPNVYGEVYVNGQRRGFPPLVVKNVPVGTARVEIRVQDAVRRSKVVRVTQGERTDLLVR